MSFEPILLSDGISKILLDDGSSYLLSHTVSPDNYNSASTEWKPVVRRGLRKANAQIYENITLPVRSNISFIKKVNILSKVLRKVFIDVSSSLKIDYKLPAISIVVETINISTMSNLRMDETLPIKGNIQLNPKIEVTSKLLMNNYNSYVSATELISVLDIIESV